MHSIPHVTLVVEKNFRDRLRHGRDHAEDAAALQLIQSPNPKNGGYTP
jgi:hypothetical protein